MFTIHTYTKEYKTKDVDYILCCVNNSFFDLIVVINCVSQRLLKDF